MWKFSPRETEKWFLFRSRCTVAEGDVFVEMLVVKEKYLYEYLGDCSHQVWDRCFEKSMYTFLTAFSNKHFPLMKGPTASGKHVLVTEVARILAQNLMIRPITPMTPPERIIQVRNLRVQIANKFESSHRWCWWCCSTTSFYKFCIEFH